MCPLGGGEADAGAGPVGSAVADDTVTVYAGLDCVLRLPLLGALILGVAPNHVDLPGERVEAGALADVHEH